MEITNGWKRIIDEEKGKDYFVKLKSFLLDEYSKNKVYPKKSEIFKCFELTDFKDVKVVVLGQDPYHQPFQAHGLCFSVNKGVKIPPSLVNIYKEINSDLGCKIASHGNLTKWATQGVLLLNTIMSVRDSSPMSHSNKGWEVFTDRVIKELNDDDTPKVFLLWGAPSRKKKTLITNPKHLILECAHPSPLSAYNGFFGCKHFSKTNEFLKRNNREPIDWQIEEI
jgi:uracil-DNA glycosylase